MKLKKETVNDAMYRYDPVWVVPFECKAMFARPPKSLLTWEKIGDVYVSGHANATLSTKKLL